MMTTDEQVLTALRNLKTAVGACYLPDDAAAARRLAAALDETNAALTRADARPPKSEGMGAVDYCPTCERWTYYIDGTCTRHTAE